MAIITIHEFDAGVQFLIAVRDEDGPLDLTDVQTITLFLQRPDKSVLTRLCDVIDATSGTASYISDPLDFDQVGRWHIQLKVTFSDVNFKHSNIVPLTVMKNLL